MEELKEFMPYIVSILTAIISGISSYSLSKRNFKNEVETIKLNNEHEINKLMEQHKVDIDNLKEKHKLEMELKEKEYVHEKEMQQLKSRSVIDEKNQELMNTALSGVVADIFKDVMSGNISPEKLEELQKKFPKKN